MASHIVEISAEDILTTPRIWATERPVWYLSEEAEAARSHFDQLTMEYWALMEGLRNVNMEMAATANTPESIRQFNERAAFFNMVAESAYAINMDFGVSGDDGRELEKPTLMFLDQFLAAGNLDKWVESHGPCEASPKISAPTLTLTRAKRLARRGLALMVAPSEKPES
jgi:hypothetical protein